MAKKDAKLAAAPDGEETPKSKKKLLVIIALVVVLLGGGGGAYFMFFASSEPKAPVAGAVVPLDPININLAGGHYLKVGLALQVIEGPAHEPDGSHALDIMIGKLSNRTVAELSSNTSREKVKAELLKEIEHAYHGDVMDIYFTEFVMQ
jgi:flagellar protein FliL